MKDEEAMDAFSSETVAIVTGASAGIGRALCLELGSRGVKVIALARRMDRLSALVRELEEQGHCASAIAVDVRDEGQITRAFDAVASRHGRLDILVNAAGIGRVAPLVAPDSEALAEMWAVNVHGLCVSTREALKIMRPSNRGHILHVSSLSGYRVQTGSGFYAATKHAVRALTEGLRRELRAEGSKVRVSAISPGDTESEFLKAMYGSSEAARAHQPAYQPMRSQDVAEAALHILSAPEHVEIHDILMRPVHQPD
ncbi:MAG: SDR family NAD(P)-dependent oxidoreductase [Myxococcota bacterium]|jgi:NADP-dependent 3-hydroxy acid dehydrogenase YdfG|nr:SDR family NAD(P)-dependent oxidoreductase [Myxococcota bacterium]